MGSDGAARSVGSRLSGISIHAPRMGSDNAIGVREPFARIFQSTLPGWGATSPLAACRRHRRHFNPRSPDGERQRVASGLTLPVNFNPRSPYGERRQQGGRGHASRDFNPRSPDGERRGVARHVHRGAGHFNPRSPDGERPDRPAQ